jgi:ABC-2 type transport system ATP-binding protein
MRARIKEMTVSAQEPSKPNEANFTQTVVASLEDVCKDYKSVKALQNVNLNVRSGEMVALLGPNGAGKTTIVKLLLGLTGPSSGQVTVFGNNPLNRRNRARTGAMLQVGKVPEALKVREHIDLFSSYYPAPLPFADTVAAAGLQGLENRLFGELSGGERQRVLLALAICGNPDLLFLDEPTVGLDVEARRILWDQIRALVRVGKTVFLTTHYMHEAEALADRVVVINRGKVVADGKMAEIKGKISGARIRCTSRLRVEDVQPLPGVRSAQIDRGILEVQANSADDVVRELLRLDPGLSGIEITKAGLEDVFLELTQNNGQ